MGRTTYILEDLRGAPEREDGEMIARVGGEMEGNSLRVAGGEILRSTYELLHHRKLKWNYMKGRHLLSS